MKRIALILLGIICISCQQSADSANKGLQEFNEFLGPDKAAALDLAVQSLDDFLATNYPEQKTQQDRTRTFLEQLSTNLAPDASWKFDTQKNLEILEKLEKSGMRQEIRLYGYEDYQPQYFIDNLSQAEGEDSITEMGTLNIELEEEELIPIAGQDSAEQAEELLREQKQYDSTLWFNVMGQFLYGIAKYAPNDTFVQDYVDARQAAGNISLGIIIQAYLSQGIDYHNPFFKRMLVADLYLDLMQMDVGRKKK